ncbi:MAG: aldose 1-epimerase family protein [Oscillospiraceae bacterium]|nr:aldose 1-epimerase family protein [Oscillospiraceae bacterium]
MLYHIENEQLFCAVDSLGAQLHSLKGRAGKAEYLWQGNPAVWYGQAPVLFPIVGRLKDDRYQYRGKTYQMPKHGFARKSEFLPVLAERERIVFELKDSEKTRAIYPFAFTLRIEYKLSKNALVATATVANAGEDTMLFSIGAHPGFNCAMGDVLRFSQPETLRSEWITEESLLAGSSYPVLEDATDLVLHEQLFAKDALILQGVRSAQLTLVRGGEDCVKFDLGAPPVLGVWAKPAAPYVCIEPWFGINDGEAATPDFSQKRLINALAPGDTFTQRWCAELPGEAG